MAEHLSSQLIDAYRERRLSSADLIQVDDHLTGCATCRHHLEVALPGSAVSLYSDLRAENEVLPGGAVSPSHVTFDQLAAYVDETLERGEKMFVTDHLASCGQCERAVDDLRTFKDEGAILSIGTHQGAMAKPAFWSRVRGMLAAPAISTKSGLAIAALLLMVVAGWLIRLAFEEKQAAPEFASKGAQPAVTPSVTPAAVATPVPATNLLLAQLTDGTGQLTLDRHGNLSGLDELPSAYQRLVKDVLTTGRLARPSSLEGLTRRTSSLMGADEQGNQFSLIAPAGMVVFSDRPTLQWTQLSGAESYVVELYDEQFNLALKSQPLQHAQWTPPEPLTRGRLYAWQVKANKDGEEVLAPKPPATQARFRVLSRAETAEITRARQTHPRSHLTLGLLFAQVGLFDEAEQELRMLVKTNPDSTIVRSLLAQIQALRR